MSRTSGSGCSTDRSTVAPSIRVTTATANANVYSRIYENVYSRIYAFVLPQLPFRLVRSESISEHAHSFFWYGMDSDLFCFSPESRFKKSVKFTEIR
jgi:hypothetical protein